MVTTLRSLVLRANALSGTLATELGRLSLLSSIELGQNTLLSGTFATQIGGLLSMATFYVVRLALNPSSFPTRRSLSNVPCSLDLLFPSFCFVQYNTRISGSLPTELYKLTALQSLYLSINSLTGTISPLISKLTALSLLDLRYDSLSGTLPTTLPTSLSYILLSRNFFSGALPTQLGLLNATQLLLLDNNTFTGSLPTQLALMTSLQMFNVFSVSAGIRKGKAGHAYTHRSA